MGILADLFIFATKVSFVITAFVCLFVLFIFLLNLARKKKYGFKVKNLNIIKQSYAETLEALTSGKEPPETVTVKNHDKKTYVIDFTGDVAASGITEFREEVTGVLSIAKPGDEIVTRLKSAGGYVHSYGLLAAQLDRIKKAGIDLTVCVDEVAASGGYMAACVADKIIAAPFSIIGSIGVVAEFPNFNRMLNGWGIDYQQITAGECKRTLSTMAPVTQDGKKKFTEQIQKTHDLFKDHIRKYRPSVDIDKVATGEHWYGHEAQELSLVDDLLTSDDYLIQKTEDSIVISLQKRKKTSLAEKLGDTASVIVDKCFNKLITKNQMTKYQ